MNRFNSLFNASQMTRNITPFAVAGGNNALGIASKGGLLSKLKGGNLSLSGILTNAQKTIGTVNQIIPLYNQIKPMVQNSKVLLNVAKGIKGDNNSKGLFNMKRRNRNYYTSYNNNPSTEATKNEEKREIKKENTNSPSKPYFL